MPPHLPGGKTGRPNFNERGSSVSTEQRETLDAILRQSAFPVGSDVDEQRRLLREAVSAQPLPADVTVTAAALGGVPTAEITVDGIEPRHVVLYFHGGVYVMSDAFLAAGLASQVGSADAAPRSSPSTTGSLPSTRIRQRSTTLLRPTKPSCSNGIAPSDIVFAGESAGGGLVDRHAGQRPRSRAGAAGRGVRDVTVRRSHARRGDHGHQARRRPAAQPGTPPTPSRRLHGGTGRRTWPDQSRVRRPVRPAAPDHPGRKSRGSPRRRRAPRATSRRRRRRGHARDHPSGASRLPGLCRRSSTRRPLRWTEPDSSCRRISPAQNASPR